MRPKIFNKRAEGDLIMGIIVKVMLALFLIFLLGFTVFKLWGYYIK